MAEEEQKENEEAAEGEEAPKKKKGLFLGGGIVGLVTTAYILSMVALPKAPEELPFQGPFIAGLAQSQDRVQVNLSDSTGKRFLVMTLKAEFMAYDEAYALEQVANPLYQAKEKDALIKIARQKSKADLDDPLGEEIFKQEVRDVIDPILFPVHVGNGVDPNQPHEESGLRAGTSRMSSTMRGGFNSHRIQLDVPGMKMRLDDGPEVEFEGYETDLALETIDGATIYVDVSQLESEFAGEVPVGTFGRVRTIYFDSFLVQ